MTGNPIMRLTSKQAQRLHLHAQGLLAPPRRRARRTDVVAAIERMALLQIDTIHVVARSPYLVLHSRLGPYPPSWLDEALADGRVFECWAHEACFAAADDFALHRANLAARAGHWSMKHARRMQDAHRAAMDALLTRIRATGAVRSSDFERTDGAKGGGWWGWKDEKRWLEALFALGELMVARRERFQRVYDLTERVRADVATLVLSSLGELRATMILRTVRALGVTPARYIADYFRMKPRVTDAELVPLVRSGALLRVELAEHDEPAYVHADHADALVRATAGRLRATHTTLLSPFDPVVWDRDRAAAMFEFDYRIECYTPAPKRRYGYFVLPILDRGELVGRLDAKAHRAEGVFEVKKVFFEAGVELDAALAARVHEAVQACAAWHETPTVRYRAGRVAELKVAQRSRDAKPSGTKKAGGSRSARRGSE